MRVGTTIALNTLNLFFFSNSLLSSTSFLIAPTTRLDRHILHGADTIECMDEEYLLHDEAIHQRKQLCVILANALDNAQLPYLEVYNALFVL